MELAWVGGREAEERQGDLGVGGLLEGNRRAGLILGGLRGTGRLGGTLRDCGLWRVGGGLTAVGLR